MYFLLNPEPVVFCYLSGCQVPECSTQILGTVAEFSAQMSQLAAPPEQGGQIFFTLDDLDQT